MNLPNFSLKMVHQSGNGPIRNISHLLPQMIKPCPVSAASAMQSLKNTIFIMKRNVRMIPASPGSDPARARVHTFFQHVTWLVRALESFSSIFQLEWKPGTALRCVARRFQSGFSTFRKHLATCLPMTWFFLRHSRSSSKHSRSSKLLVCWRVDMQRLSKKLWML